MLNSPGGPRQARRAAWRTLRERYYIAVALLIVALIVSWQQPLAGTLLLTLVFGWAVWWFDPVTRLHGGRTLRAHYGPLTAVRFSDDGTRVRATAQSGALLEWDVASRQLCQVTIGPLSVVPVPARSPDGQREAVILNARTAQVRDRATSGAVATLRGHRRAIAALAFSPNGTCLASAGRDGVVKLWRLP